MKRAERSPGVSRNFHRHLHLMDELSQRLSALADGNHKRILCRSLPGDLHDECIASLWHVFQDVAPVDAARNGGAKLHRAPVGKCSNQPYGRTVNWAAVFVVY